MQKQLCTSASGDGTPPNTGTVVSFRMHVVMMMQFNFLCPLLNLRRKGRGGVVKCNLLAHPGLPLPDLHVTPSSGNVGYIMAA